MPDKLDDAEEEASPEAKALASIAEELARLRFEQRSPSRFNADEMFKELIGDPVEDREIERAEREREQAKLYKLVVLIAAISAIASIASVVVALLNA